MRLFEHKETRLTPECVQSLLRAEFPRKIQKGDNTGDVIQPFHLDLLTSDYIRAFRHAKFGEPSEYPIISKISLEAFEQMIKYATTDDELEIGGVDGALIFEMRALAFRYRLENLTRLLDRYLQGSVTVHNVCDIYVKAHLHKLNRLINFCGRFMDLHAEVILRSESFCRLPGSVLKKLLSRDSFYAPEIDIFRAVRRWCEVRSMDEDALEVLNEVRLSLISLEDLLAIVKPSNLIPAHRMAVEISRRIECADTDSRHRGVLVCGENVATADRRASLVAQGFPLVCCPKRNFQQLVDWDQRLLKHGIGDSTGIVIVLAEPYFINRLYLHLYDYEPCEFSYYVEMSTSANDWNRVIDRTHQLRRSHQLLSFETRVVRYIRVVGTHCTRGNEFLVHSIRAYYSEKHLKCDEESETFPMVMTDRVSEEEPVSPMSID